MEVAIMRFCDFLNKLNLRFACRNQEVFVTDIFSALCGGDIPVGLTGYDATYRKLLFSGNNKKYKGLSAPIKTHILENKNKDTFIAYCDETVSLKEYPVLCGDFKVEIDTDRFILFEAIYEQFLEFAKCKTDNAKLIITDMVSELARLRITSDATSASSLYSGDDFVVVTKPQDMTVAFYQEFLVSWTIKNIGSVIWNERYLFNTNSKQTGVRGVTARVNIPTLRPNEQTKIEVKINAQGHEKLSNSIWEICDSEGNPCFPNKQNAITVTVCVTNPNRKVKTEVF